MTKPKSKNRKSARDRVNSKKPAHIDVPIALDPAAVDELSRLRSQLEQTRTLHELRSNQEPPADETEAAELAAKVAELSATLAALETELDDFTDENPDAVMVFRVRSVGRPMFDALLSEHRPTKEQRDQAATDGVAGDLNWNHDTFPEALVARAVAGEVVDGEFEAFTPDEAAEIVEDMWASDDWSPAETGELFTAAYMLATQRQRVADLGKGSKRTRTSAKS